MAQLLITLSEAESHFAVLHFCNTCNSGNTACFNCSVFTHKVEGARD